MNAIRKMPIGSALIVALTAALYGYADHPELADSSGHFGTGAACAPPLPCAIVHQLGWGADGRKLMALVRSPSRLRGAVVVRDLETGQQFSTDAEGAPISTVVFAPDGEHVLMGTHTGELWWCNPEVSDSRLLMELPAKQYQRTAICAVAISGDAAWAAAATNDRRIALWNPGDSTSLSWHSSGTAPLNDIFLSVSPAILVGTATDGSISVWEIADADHLLRVHHITAGQHWVRAAVPVGGRDGQFQILSVGYDDDVRVWDCAGRREEWRRKFDCRGPMALALAVDGKTAAWGGADGKIVVWDLEHFQMECEITSSQVYQLKFSPDGQSLAVCGSDTVVRLYDVRTGSESGAVDFYPGSPEGN